MSSRLSTTLHGPTLVGPDTTHHGTASGDRRPALTIVWHPDIRRVGERALLEPRRTPISRLEPIFAGGGAEEGTSLADPYVSYRDPSATIVQLGQGVEIHPGAARVPLKLEGAALNARAVISPEAIESGVLLTIARRIVLCLHYARAPRPASGPDHGIVGVSDSIAAIRAEIERVAPASTPVLIRGETGTGKELVALALRALSPRAAAPFVAVNMAKIQRDRAVADMFGYERGAFTGATSSSPGAFRSADGGTLFLDEVGEMPMEVQVVLLRVSEDGLVQPLGSFQHRKVDVRLVAATDADLTAALADGRFSPALYERLARYPISLPPLRERREDIGVLLRHLLRHHLAAHRQPDRLATDPAGEPWLSASAVAALAAFDWPRNVRQLWNVAERIVLDNLGSAKAELSAKVREDIAAPSTSAPAGAAPPTAEQVAEALKRHAGNIGRAAAELGVSRTTFYELRKRNPYLPQLSKIPDEDILSTHAEHGGDVARTARALSVPVKALQDRLARLRRQRG